MQRYLQSDSNGGTTFDPDAIRVLADAFDAAWRSLQTYGRYFTSRGQAEATREKLALRIIEMAKHGERDLDRLRDGGPSIIWRERLRSGEGAVTRVSNSRGASPRTIAKSCCSRGSSPLP